METLDLVVIGAGIAGLSSAKIYHQLNNDKTLAILDDKESVGGVWAKSRLYSELRTNNMLGTYQFPDFPMTTEQFGVKPGDHIPGIIVHEYLASYAEKFGIADKIRFHHKVVTAEHRDGSDGGWILTMEHDGKPSKILAKKLIVATGVTSEPFLPRIDGQGEFSAPLFHSADFLQHADTLKTTDRVTVFGGSKSAWDAVYAYGTRGIKVDWVIRESGHGAVWMAPPYVTPLKKWLEKLVNTRMLTWFSPCIWGFADGYNTLRNFYHGTSLGRAITNVFWSVLGNDVITLNKYDSHPELKKIKPWSHPMFTASSFSIYNYPTSFWDLLTKGAVKVHIADITGLSHRKVHLSDGTQLPADALCCVTGWKHVPPVKFLPEGIDVDIGLPHTPSKAKLFTKEAVEKADTEILGKFPRLKDQPVQNSNLKPLLATKGLSTTDKINPSTPLTPWTLYRFMVPPSGRFMQTRDIAFAGICMNFSTMIMAHIQGLWIAAYFADQLPVKTIPPVDEKRNQEGRAKTLDNIQHETVLHARFGRWRYPAGKGELLPDFVFDAVPYLDLMVGDMGLKVHRKAGWLKEATEPYGPEDYEDLMSEWVEAVEGK
ncbi:hypothetical protein QBC36DRAFT_188164 [Triangularia setosa]|uniref:Flavin-containing monooxygenase n=1 Tax=Triangularia setosa TaxID=2587417 RepID=A0AAN6W9R2_9PEZI|nr:hypothetical protein QBC36DRAFT_188164 [Podospora setosa]